MLKCAARIACGESVLSTVLATTPLLADGQAKMLAFIDLDRNACRLVPPQTSPLVTSDLAAAIPTSILSDRPISGSVDEDAVHQRQLVDGVPQTQRVSP